MKKFVHRHARVPADCALSPTLSATHLSLEPHTFELLDREGLVRRSRPPLGSWSKPLASTRSGRRSARARLGRSSSRSTRRRTARSRLKCSTRSGYNSRRWAHRCGVQAAAARARSNLGRPNERARVRTACRSKERTTESPLDGSLGSLLLGSQPSVAHASRQTAHSPPIPSPPCVLPGRVRAREWKGGEGGRQSVTRKKIIDRAARDTSLPTPTRLPPFQLSPVTIGAAVNDFVGRAQRVGRRSWSVRRLRLGRRALSS